MSLQERRQQFEAASKRSSLFTRKTKFSKAFGISNSSKVMVNGLQLGVPNLDNIAADIDGFAIACTIMFPPEDEVYFTVYVRSGTDRMVARLDEMKAWGAGAPPEAETDSEDEEPESKIKYRPRNNLTPIVLAKDGCLHLRNSGFWDELPENTASLGTPVPIDRIDVAIYPPRASARRSLLTKEFVGYLGSLAGREKIHEITVWSDTAALSASMKRLPKAIPLGEIEASIAAMGGHYSGGEVRKYHAALNFLDNKHFVILSGLSGTGKTQLAVQYASAVHGLKDTHDADPFNFVCPVRPEWTDPSGLTGYYDVLSNRYIVPPFLEAVLLAVAHRETPVFVVLDEMNLARVEYYFSDILSAMEVGNALQLHSSGVPIEGSNGTPIPASLPMPPNLYITGTINVDETTNPISDKVLDRAVVIDMSTTDMRGFIETLVTRNSSLAEARAGSAKWLLSAHDAMSPFSQGFGYRVVEEVIRYHAFASKQLGTNSDEIIDDMMVQKILIKLKGSERQRPMLNHLKTTLKGLPQTQAFIDRLIFDLDEFGSFQASR